MTDRFGLYAQYYDLLYSDKDYPSEAAYVNGLIKQHAPSAIRLLNLGCGTGKHDYALAQFGYHVTGVDLSSEMVSLATMNIPCALHGGLNFLEGDIRKIELNTTFDAVISLFHVMSYQVTNNDLQQVIDVCYQHLSTDGVFIFDCWYGPGVLTDPPVIRTKNISNDKINVTRLAEPVLDSIKNTVDVNYTIRITPGGSADMTIIKETHVMRYLFVQEIELLIKKKFKLLNVYNWLSDKEPDTSCWNAVFILQKI